MPEVSEGVEQGLVCDKFNEEQPASEKLVLGLHVDATQAEAERSLAGSLPHLGHVYPLQSSEKIQRGQCNDQTQVYPPKYSHPDNIPIESHGLVLSKVAIDPRNVILGFIDNNDEEYWLQVQLLKHTVVQIYKKEDWNEAICKVPKQSCGFKIGLAIEFPSYVMAFCVLDLLVQFHWAPSRAKLPAQHPHVYSEYERFLRELVNWLISRRFGNEDGAKAKSRNGNAMAIVRSSGKFPGAGVYTVPEIFHRAGLSPFLTEAEVFDSASRTARLCAAFYHLAALAHSDVWSLVQKHLQGYVLAVHKEDRIKYSQMLLVYGKERASLSERHHSLWVQYEARKFICTIETLTKHCGDGQWVRSTSELPPDVFEPTLVRLALLHNDLNLGTLIFGTERWSALWEAENMSFGCPASDNPLSHYFSRPDVLPFSHLWLDETAYDCLFIEPSFLKKKKVEVSAYRLSNKNIWSILSPFPPNSVSDTPQYAHKPKIAKIQEPKDDAGKLHVCSPEERKKLSLSYQTQCTGLFTVGPLDYCGIARLVKGRGESKMLVCDNDPRENPFYAKRNALTKETAKLRGKGTEKVGLSTAIKRKVFKALPFCCEKPDSEDQDEAARPRKKPRRSADRDLVLLCGSSSSLEEKENIIT